MQSEIPQLQVITAISDADCEDFVSQLLFSQGWSIIYRAIEMSGLTSFLDDRTSALRTVVIYKSDLPEFNQELLNKYLSPKVTHICLDNIETNSHILMTYIRGQLRLPLIVDSASHGDNGDHEDKAQLISSLNQRTAVKPPCVITVTGTVGAPGRSSVALNIANYLAEEFEVNIYDGDSRAPALDYLLGRASKSSSKLSLVNISTLSKSSEVSIPDQSRISVVDIGPLPPLEEVVNDRRWQAGFINRTLEETTTLIYLCKSNGLSLIRLEQFISQFPVLLRKLPIIYILNQSRSTREGRALANRFTKICNGEISIILPANEQINTNLAIPAKRETAFGKAIAEIGRIAQIVK
ncbi:BY-kinase domain containing protein [actinobacterium SCGC AAA044-D11]